MKILAIETSCDDTGIAILETPDKKSGNFSVLANEVASQIKIHKPYGGVYPFLAKREHIKNLPIVFKKALKKAKISNPKKEIDLIAVTNGPGLEPCLWTGINFAKDLSKKWNLPIIPVNHIEGHILISNFQFPISNLPAIALVVSGGHTQLILMEKMGKYKIIGETRDDAAGECFDKAAKILGLGYPGGPVISKLASQKTARSPASLKLPRPMINTKDYDFSFSGLKTAILYKVKEDCGTAPLRQGFAGRQYIKQMCVEIQQAIIDVLLKKTFKAVKDFNAKTIILGGGVSANLELRRQFKLQASSSKLQVIFPPPDLSTDNGLMIAIAGYFNAIRLRQGFGGQAKKRASWQSLKADSNLRLGE